MNFDEILKTNEELSGEMKNLQEKFQDMEGKLKTANEKSKFLERQKQLDDMAIAGLKDIKEESTKEIIKLNGWLKTIKLDLLAERQLRRIQQQTLHDLDPQNENYNIANIIADESKINEALNNRNGSMLMDTADQPALIKPIVPFWKLNCEAKSVVKEASNIKTTPYIIPSKIQKAANVPKEPQVHQRVYDKMMAYRRRSPSSKSDEKPQGFQFILPHTSASNAPQPSTSTAMCSSSKTQKRMFGEGKPIFEAGPTPSATSSPTLNNTAFNFSADAPAFVPSTSNPSSSIQLNFSTLLRNYRERNETSPSSSSPQSSKLVQGNGPKISDR